MGIYNALTHEQLVTVMRTDVSSFADGVALVGNKSAMAELAMIHTPDSAASAMQGVLGLGDVETLGALRSIQVAASQMPHIRSHIKPEWDDFCNKEIIQ